MRIKDVVTRLKKIQSDLDKALTWMGMPSRIYNTGIPPLDSARQELTKLIRDLERSES